jgi:hypothetical protein
MRGHKGFSKSPKDNLYACHRQDYKSNYKKNTRELNLLKLEMIKEKVKWTKAHKKLTKSAEIDPVNLISEDEVSKQSDSVRSKRKPDSSSSSSSSSASDTDSERENGSRKDNYLLENKIKNKIKILVLRQEM